MADIKATLIVEPWYVKLAEQITVLASNLRDEGMPAAAARNLVILVLKESVPYATVTKV